MNIAKKWILAALIGTSVLGGAAGATIASVATSNAQTATPAVSTTSSGSSSAPAAAPSNGGRFVPNEDPAHEARESAQREAQENAGQQPTVP